MTALVVLASFVLGLTVGWATTLLPGAVRAEPEVSESPSPSPTVDIPEDVDVPPLAPIVRDLDEQDREAGVTTLEPTFRGEGTFTVVSAKKEPRQPDAPLRWVSIAVEDGVDIDSQAAKNFVMNVLQDNRSWGSDARLEFVETDGVADYRFLFASPFTAAAMCPEVHLDVDAGPVVTESEAPAVEGDEAGGDVGIAGEADPACAEDGVIMISVYDWTAAFPGFGEDRTSARAYLVNHLVGHLMGNAESECVSGRSSVMDNQRVEALVCEPNAWPFPDAVVATPGTDASPSPSVPASLAQ